MPTQQYMSTTKLLLSIQDNSYVLYPDTVENPANAFTLMLFSIVGFPGVITIDKLPWEFRFNPEVNIKIVIIKCLKFFIIIIFQMLNIYLQLNLKSLIVEHFL